MGCEELFAVLNRPWFATSTGRRTRAQYRLRRAAVLLLAGTFVVAISVGVASALRGPPRSSGTSGSTPTRTTTDHRLVAGTQTSSGKAETPTTVEALPLRGLAVTMSETTFVDSSRPVVSHGITVANSRTLPTYIWSPTTGGPYPLVMFAPGYDIGPLQYERFCSTLASSGYVVAAPSFPLEDPSQGFVLDRGDIPNEATDVSFIITSLVAEAASRDIAPSQIAVVGHSDGADVALLTGYGPGKVDSRIQAVVADAPDPMTGVQTSTVPLLLIQGTADSVVPYSSSQTVFSQVQAPVYYLSLLGANHLPPIAGGTVWTPVLDQAVAQFLDATVAHRGPDTAALPSQLAASPLVRFEFKP